MGEIFVHENPRPAMATTGERLTAGHLLETELEHFHRYYLARHYARGKDVLDIASGEGYGAAMLAQTAATVVGVDVSSAAVAHAKASYPAPNLGFRQGNACALPLADASVDMVTSFETIEHLYDHAAFLSEIRRVLRPGGMFVVSTPDRDIYSPPNSDANPHHVHELSRASFHNLCAAYFAHVAIYAQTAMIGSVLAADHPTGPRLIFERRGTGHVEATIGPMRGKFCLCLASDAPLPDLGDSLLIQRTSLGPTEAAHAEARADHEAALAEAAALRAALAARDDERARRDGAEQRRDEVLNGAVAALAEAHRLAFDQVAAERDRLDRALASREAELAELRGAAARDAAGRGTSGGRRVRQRIQSVAARFLARRRAAELRASALFDGQWYLDRNDDVREAGIDPARHYVMRGAKEGRDPGPDFSTGFYLAAHRDVARAGINPLLHYERLGRAENRAIAPAGTMFDAPVRMLEAGTLEARGQPGARVVYISGEPDTPGHLYRVARPAAAAAAAGAHVRILRADALAPGMVALAACDMLVIWRAAWTPVLEAAIGAARRGGAHVVYDVDDLMFEPELARVEIIDGIRSQGFDAGATAELFGRIARALAACDSASAPTAYLAGRMQRQGRPARVLPNGFDEATWAAARLALRTRRGAPSDGLIRIGYPAGSRTHQKDFAVAVPALARVLAERPAARLVLFRHITQSCIDIEEFPALRGLRGQVEWREMVPLAQLPAEIARFDIAIAPLEVANPFCEAKSELKFFESALVEVPLIASPTAVFRAAIDPGRTGFLAGDDAGWEDALLALVDDANLRAAIGAASYRAVLWAYGPQRRVQLMRGLLAEARGTPADAARAFELELHRRAAPAPPPITLPPHRVEILQDRLLDAAASVVIPLHDYAHTIVEALESAAAQSLAPLDLIVVDDASNDDGAAVAREWMASNCHRFGRLVLARIDVNAGLGPARNVGFALAETRYVILFDADNRLLPQFAARCVAAADAQGAAFVYPMIRTFGDRVEVLGRDAYAPLRLACGNFIDAMALVRVSAWAAVGGCDDVRFGWEDYDLWCRFAERGMFAAHVPEVLGEYRIHAGSMLRTLTDLADNKRALIADMRRRHGWVLDGVAAD